MKLSTIALVMALLVIAILSSLSLPMREGVCHPSLDASKVNQ